MEAFGSRHDDTTDLRRRGRMRVYHDRSTPLQSIPRDERKEVILDRIVHSLKSDAADESAWTLSRLARAANTTRVTLYGYFGNLEGLRAAIQFKLVGQVRPIGDQLKGIPSEERPAVAVSLWMNWIDENRRLAIRALWADESNAAFETFVNRTAQQLILQIADVYLGMKDPSRDLQRQIEVYLRAAEFCLRMWLLEGRMQRDEVQTTIERLTQDVVRMGLGRPDVPKPLPGMAEDPAGSGSIRTL
jgi:AcrR family transcriptional regulator